MILPLTDKRRQYLRTAYTSFSAPSLSNVFGEKEKRPLKHETAPANL
jgi:hypothetical protein